MADILAEIGISQHEFKMMCVVNGTDYDAAAAGILVGTGDRIFQIYDLLMEFKRLSPKEQNKYQDCGGFYDWLDERKKGVVNSGVISMMTTEAMFDTSSSSGNNNGTLDQQYKQLVISNRDDIYKDRIMVVMMKDDFIFID